MNPAYQNHDRCEMHSVIQFFSMEDNRVTDIHCQLIVVYYEVVMTRQNMMNWVYEFKEERTQVHDEERSGCPSVVSDAVL